eukprot:488846-Alexandrium_andersonii.AAC.1
MRFCVGDRRLGTTTLLASFCTYPEPRMGSVSAPPGDVANSAAVEALPSCASVRLATSSLGD